MENKRRNIKYDIIRTLAIFCVVLCHCAELIYNALLVTNRTSLNGFFVLVFFTIGRLGVPLFLFLSGFLLLKKQMETDEDVLKFYKKNLLPLFIANEIWVILYNIYLSFTGTINVTIADVIQELLLLKSAPPLNMWYMPMILGMYLAIPFLAKIVKVFSRKSLWIGMSVVLIICFLIPSICHSMKFFNLDVSFNSILDLEFLGGLFGAYLILGYFIGNLEKLKVKNWLIGIIGMLSFYIVLYYEWKTCNCIWYDSIFLLISACSLFYLLLQINEKAISPKIGKVFTYLAKRGLAVFFIHIIILDILFQFILRWKLHNLILLLISFLLTSFLSIGVLALFRKREWIKKYVFMIKE